MTLPDIKKCNIAIIGLGYVGLPLSIEFAKQKICIITKEKLQRAITGFDINIKRINSLKKNIDKTGEINSLDLLELKKNKKILFTSEESFLSSADVYIVTVPTPIDEAKRPDINPIKMACKTIGKSIKFRKSQKDTCPVIIFESTVYPGLTEEICVNILEKESGLIYNEISNNGFVCGYSPERINPGDKIHTLANIKKITSGSTKEVADWVDSLYGSIIKAGTFKASSIKEAEAAKIIENTQRDLNIALINELSIIFSKMDIDTNNVLEAASTKWNFLRFTPGLVGGHCIGVDPYYLTYKSEKCGYLPEVVLSGRRINDNMANWIIERLTLFLSKKLFFINGSNLLILGFTFKEDCRDIRNTQVINLYKKAREYGINVYICDPNCEVDEVKDIYKIKIYNNLEELEDVKFESCIVAVAHKEFKEWKNLKWKSLVIKNGIIYDLKNIVPKNISTIRL